jgi:WD40 repeat protein
MTARVWDLSGPMPVATVLQGHGSPVYAASFSPDGRRVVTASDDKTARVWDLSDPTPVVIVLAGHGGPVYAASFSPDGRRVVTASADSAARVWDTPPVLELIQLAKRALTRCLTIGQRDALGLPVPSGRIQDRERIAPPPCPFIEADSGEAVR